MGRKIHGFRYRPKQAKNREFAMKKWGRNIMDSAIGPNRALETVKNWAFGHIELFWATTAHFFNQKEAQIN